MPIGWATLPTCSPASVRPPRSATITARTEPAAALAAEASPGSQRSGVLETYAVWWIRRGLASAVGDARTIRIRSHASGQLAAIERAERALERLAPGSRSREAIAERTGVSVRRDGNTTSRPQTGLISRVAKTQRQAIECGFAPAMLTT
jgi:hypothetical protein